MLFFAKFVLQQLNEHVIKKKSTSKWEKNWTDCRPISIFNCFNSKSRRYTDIRAKPFVSATRPSLLNLSNWIKLNEVIKKGLWTGNALDLKSFFYRYLSVRWLFCSCGGKWEGYIYFYLTDNFKRASGSLVCWILFF